jgi:hypothetical protein
VASALDCRRGLGTSSRSCCCCTHALSDSPQQAKLAKYLLAIICNKHQLLHADDDMLYASADTMLFLPHFTDHRGTPEAPGRTVTLAEEEGAITVRAMMQTLQQCAVQRLVHVRTVLTRPCC